MAKAKGVKNSTAKNTTVKTTNNTTTKSTTASHTHSYSSWSLGKAATLSADDYWIRKCSYGNTQKKAIYKPTKLYFIQNKKWVSSYKTTYPNKAVTPMIVVRSYNGSTKKANDYTIPSGYYTVTYEHNNLIGTGTAGQIRVLLSTERNPQESCCKDRRDNAQKRNRL